MARQRKNEFEVLIEGEGISPDSVSLPELLDVLKATSQAIAAIAAEAGVDAPSVSLKQVRKGSAAYSLWSSDPVWPAVLVDLHGAVKSRSEGSSPKLHKAMNGLFRASRQGGVAVRFVNVDTVPTSRRLTLAEPLPLQRTEVFYEQTVYGRIVGVSELRDRRHMVKLEFDGRREDIVAEPKLAKRAGGLFGKEVEATLECSEGDEKTTLRMRDLIAFGEADFLGELESVREHMSEIFGDVDGEQLRAAMELED